MQIGFVGLGKMGGNMVRRIERDSDHEVVAFDPNPDAVSAAEGHGARGASEATRSSTAATPTGTTTSGGRPSSSLAASTTPTSARPAASGAWTSATA
jgi:3-hydroxyacyl-CoA dehydrogenase